MNSQVRFALGRIAGGVAGLLLLVAAPQAWQAAAPAQATSQKAEVRLAGLQQTVEVLRDQWGVPHIYAKTQHDLFFAQGYVVAQDRMWQLELWHRKAMGRMAEIFGADYVEHDRYARLLRYRGDWDAEWKSYSPDAKEIAEAFTSGINAYVREMESAPEEKLPPEFRLLGIRPTSWTPEVVVSRLAAYPMTGNAGREMARAEAVAMLGAERVARLFPTDPPRPQQPEAGLDLASLDFRALAGLARASAEGALDGDYSDWGAADAEMYGSNNWTVHGKKTKTGKPILANDPHRALLLPSLRYIVHLVGPGWNVIGAGEPALPGVSIGHNERIAFGLTIFAADQQDVVLVTDEQARAETKSAGDEIRVKGESAARDVPLRFIGKWPVVSEGARGRYALRWVGSEPGTAGYLAGLAISRAQNWKEFRAALGRWKLPPENFVYADVEGNIGYQAAALVPRRTCDGLLPARGDSNTCKWDGWLSLDELPHEFNPARGFIATANHNTLPAGEKNLIGFEWATPYRIDRIREVLTQARAFTVEDAQKLQADVESLLAREMKPLFGSLGTGECPQSGAREAYEKNNCAAGLLRAWDGRMTADSAAAAIFAVWVARLRDNTYRLAVPEPARRATAGLISLPAMVRALLAADDDVFGQGDPRSKESPAFALGARDGILDRSLTEAVAELERRLGPDMSKWRWGALHMASFTHPLAQRSTEARVFNLGPVEKPGDGNTVNAAGGANFRHSSGASFRQVIDLSNWDNSTGSNVPGQSGVPGSAHYSDLLPLWAREQQFPLLYSRAAIEKNTTQRIRLVPKP